MSCGILALDEPTTNLDHNNKVGYGLWARVGGSLFGPLLGGGEGILAASDLPPPVPFQSENIPCGGYFSAVRSRQENSYSYAAPSKQPM